MASGDAQSLPYLHSSPEVIRLTVMLDIRYLLSLHQAEDLLFERGIDIAMASSAVLCTVRFWWNRFGRSLPRRSESEASIIVRFRIGGGTWTRLS